MDAPAFPPVYNGSTTCLNGKISSMASLSLTKKKVGPGFSKLPNIDRFLCRHGFLFDLISQSENTHNSTITDVI